jgi:hypothetical protein
MFDRFGAEDSLQAGQVYLWWTIQNVTDSLAVDRQITIGNIMHTEP